MKSFGPAKQVAKTLTILCLCLLVSAVILVAAYQNLTLSIPAERDAFSAKCFPYILGLSVLCLLSGGWYVALKEINAKYPNLWRLSQFRFVRRKHNEH